MCRCKKPNWVNKVCGGSGNNLPAISKCEGCGDIYFGYAIEAEAECRRWQAFFSGLNAAGIVNNTAQVQLYHRYKSEILQGIIKPSSINEALLLRFQKEMSESGISCL